MSGARTTARAHGRGSGWEENIPVTRGHGHRPPPNRRRLSAAVCPRRVRPTPRRAPRPVAVGVDESRTDASSSLALESRPWSASFSACDLARRRRRGDVTKRGTGDLHASARFRKRDGEERLNKKKRTPWFCNSVSLLWIEPGTETWCGDSSLNPQAP